MFNFYENRIYIKNLIEFIKNELGIKTPITIDKLEYLITFLGGTIIAVSNSTLAPNGAKLVIHDSQNIKFDILYLENKPLHYKLFSILQQIAYILLYLLNEDLTLLTDEEFNSLGISRANIEWFCNEFSIEFLLPKKKKKKELSKYSVYTTDVISTISEKFNVAYTGVLVRGSILGFFKI